MKPNFYRILGFCLTVILFGLVVFPLESFSNQDKKLALVIGNGAYDSTPLKNPVNDATDISHVLEQLGFEVILRTDANKKTMLQAISQFGKKLRKSQVGLFFYAGHGIQLNGVNYMLPTGAFITDENDIEIEGVDIRRILGRMESAENDINILFLDACRNNPFKRSFRSMNRGLAKMDAPKGTFITYATSPGKVAADGVGRNSPFTQQLLKNMPLSGKKIEDIIKLVRIGVLQLTDGKQMPWQASSLTGDFYFVPPGSDNLRTITPIKKQKISQATASSSDIVFWESIKGSENSELYKAYLEAFPNGIFSKIAMIHIKQYSSSHPLVPVPLDDTRLETEKNSNPIPLDQYNLAIFSSKFKSEATNYRDFILRKITDILDGNKHINLKASSYIIENKDNLRLLNLTNDTIWISKSFWSSKKPDQDLIYKRGKEENVDAVLIISVDVESTQVDVGDFEDVLRSIKIFLFDINNKKYFVQEKNISRIIMGSSGIYTDLEMATKSTLIKVLKKLDRSIFDKA